MLFLTPGTLKIEPGDPSYKDFNLPKYVLVHFLKIYFSAFTYVFDDFNNEFHIFH